MAMARKNVDDTTRETTLLDPLRYFSGRKGCFFTALQYDTIASSDCRGNLLAKEDKRCVPGNYDCNYTKRLPQRDIEEPRCIQASVTLSVSSFGKVVEVRGGIMRIEVCADRSAHR